MNKKIAYILRHAPYSSDFASDAIDAVLAGGLYGQSVSLFFLSDGVFQLFEAANDKTNPTEKTLTKKLKALNLYDIEHIFVCSESLKQRGIKPEQLCINTKPLDKNALNASIRQHDSILSF